MTGTVKIVRADEGRVVEDEVAVRSAKRWDVRRAGLPYRANRRAMKSIARYFAPSRAASFQRKILLTSFCVFWSRRAIHRGPRERALTRILRNRGKQKIQQWYTGLSEPPAFSKKRVSCFSILAFAVFEETVFVETNWKLKSFVESCCSTANANK